jgi:hypothetical protein
VITVDKIRQLIQQFGEAPRCQDFLERVLVQLCLCAFRKDVFQHIRPLLKKNCVDDALAGHVPLCWPSMNRVLRQGPAYLVTGKRLAVQSIDVLFVWLWEWKDGSFQRQHWQDKPYRLLYQRSYEAIRLVRGKERARAWKQQLKGTFVRSHWLLPYPQGNRFMKRQGRGEQQQVCWWSSYHAGVHRYYQAQAPQPAGEPLPATDVAHYPLTGWRRSSSATEYMPYDVWPAEDLAQLSETELFEQAEQLAAEGQLLDEIGQAREATPSTTMPVELYSIEESPRLTRQASRVGQAWAELQEAKQRQAAVEYPCPSIEAGEETSDEERLGAVQQRRRDDVAAKQAELAQLRAEEAAEEQQRKADEEERQRARLRQWEAARARERRQRIRHIHRMQRRRLDEIAAEELERASKQWVRGRKRDKRRPVLRELFSRVID